MHTRIPLHGCKRSCHSCPGWVNASNKNTPRIHIPRRWLDKEMATYAKISPKMVNPREIAGNAEEEEEEEDSYHKQIKKPALSMSDSDI